MAKDLTTLKPRAIESYFRDLVRRLFGDAVENDAAIYASGGGNYRVAFELDGHEINFGFKKKSANKIAKAIRALK